MSGAEARAPAAESRARATRGKSAALKVKALPAVAGGAVFVASFMDASGAVDVDRVASVFRMSKGQLAETAGLALASVTKSDRRNAPKAQTRVNEILEIINRIRDWARGEAQAMAWYRSQPIPALDGRTAEALVKAGRAQAVREYLDVFALGGFA